MIYKLGDLVPKIDQSSYVHPAAVVIGDVIIGKECFVAPCAVIRGDRGKIIIGNFTNIQDGVIIHSHGSFETTVGDWVNIGHNATLHCRKVEDHASIGMGAILGLGCEIGSGTIVGDAALVPQYKVLDRDSIYIGVPVKKLREITSDDPAKKMIDDFRRFYVAQSKRYKEELTEIK
jgi:phenylacetic acid degradation protein